MSAWNSSAPIGRIVMKFDIYVFFFLKSVEKIQEFLKCDKNNGDYTCRSIYIYDHISLYSSKNEKFFEKKVVKKIKIYILCSINVFKK